MKKRFFLFLLLLGSLCTLSACSLVHHNSDKNSGPVIKRVWRPHAFTSLKVTTSFEDIDLRTGKKCKVVYYGHQKFLPQVSVNSGTLSINRKQSCVGYKINDNQTITIYLPKKKLQSLTLYSSEGDIDLNGLIQAKRSSISSDDGDITVDHLVTEQGNASSYDGDLTFYILNSKKGFRLSSDDGDINVKKSNATGYHLSSDDGDVIYYGEDYDNDDDDGGSYHHHLASQNVLNAHSDDGDVTVN